MRLLAVAVDALPRDVDKIHLDDIGRKRSRAAIAIGGNRVGSSSGGKGFLDYLGMAILVFGLGSLFIQSCAEAVGDGLAYLVVLALLALAGWIFLALLGVLGAAAKRSRSGRAKLGLPEDGDELRRISAQIDQALRSPEKLIGGNPFSEEYFEYLWLGYIKKPQFDYKLLPKTLNERLESPGEFRAERQKRFTAALQRIRKQIAERLEAAEVVVRAGQFQQHITNFDFLVSQQRFSEAGQLLERLQREFPQKGEVLVVHFQRLQEAQTYHLGERLRDV